MKFILRPGHTEITDESRMKREQNVFIRAYPRFIRQKKERIFSRMSRGQSTDKLEINGLVTQPIADELQMNYG